MTKNDDLEFSDFGRSPRFLPGWWIPATFIAAAVAIAIYASPAKAAPESKIDPVTDMIVISKAVDLLNALNALGIQHDELVGQGSNQKVIAVPFSFSADTLWAISDNTTALRKVITTYQETIKAMTTQAEAKNGGPLKPAHDAVLDSNGVVVKAEVPSAEQKALTDAIQKVFDGERPVAKLFHIKRGDLCLGGKANGPDCPKDAANKIAPGIISSLAPILDP